MTTSRTADTHLEDLFHTGRENLPTEAQTPGATDYLAQTWGGAGWGFIIDPPA